MKNPATDRQPPPQKGKTAVLDWLNSRYLHRIANIYPALLERAEMGREKYGTILYSHNGRQAVTDALREALDLVMYTAQWVIEGQDPHRAARLLSQAIALAEELTRTPSRLGLDLHERLQPPYTPQDYPEHLKPLDPAALPLHTPLWCAYGESAFITTLKIKVVLCPHDGKPVVWGYSVYGGRAGFRTLGQDLADFMRRESPRFFATLEALAYDLDHRTYASNFAAEAYESHVAEILNGYRTSPQLKVICWQQQELNGKEHKFALAPEQNQDFWLGTFPTRAQAVKHCKIWGWVLT